MYTGNSAYCYSNSLHMCLQHAGMREIPNVGLLECATGMPFGTSFLNFKMPLFFPNPAKSDPDQGLSQALGTLGWTCELWQGNEAETARAELEVVLRYGPVLLGPVDMSFLRYDPNHTSKQGGDHFVVALSIEDTFVRLHDPQFYPYAVLPINQLMQAWNASTIGYIDKTYTLRHSFREQHRFFNEQVMRATFEVARQLQTDCPDGPVIYGGVAAFDQAVALLEQQPSPDFAGLLVHFALPIGARRSIDAMQFMKQAGKEELSKLYDTKAKLFGRAQYYAATGNWTKVVETFNGLAMAEGQLAEKLSS
jgi:hypothetical protein